MAEHTTHEKLAELRRLRQATFPASDWRTVTVGPDGWIVSDPAEGEPRLASRVHADLVQKVRMRGANAEFAAAAHAAIPELCDEIERLRGLMAESPLLSHLAVDPGGRLRLEGTVPHWMARRVAESFFETLADAENFVVVHFDSEQGPIEVTVRRPGGKPVATVQAEQLAEIARLKAEVERLKGAPMTDPPPLVWWRKDEYEYLGFWADGRRLILFVCVRLSARRRIDLAECWSVRPGDPALRWNELIHCWADGPKPAMWWAEHRFAHEWKQGERPGWCWTDQPHLDDAPGES